MMNLLLGYDIGSSSIKASLLNADTGELVASSFSPKEELKIESPQSGWAEQHPEVWWENLTKATKDIISEISGEEYKIHGIGISYQMHGLVVVDKDKNVIHRSIIWCDSRAVETGNEAAEKIGTKQCLTSYLNLPGNFTASKLKWLKENQPDVYSKVNKFMLPGDFIAMKLTGEIRTTVSGLSEGILWNFEKQEPAYELLNQLNLEKDLVAETVETFGIQGKLTEEAANTLGLTEGIPISYRAGDQPNNALSLNVLKDGEVAATAGTSGVVYGITMQNFIDEKSRVNPFAHVNYTKSDPLKGVLLCVNGTGILYRWLKSELFGNNYSYEELNSLSADVPAGSEGLFTLPFGNGSERILNNENVGGSLLGLDFNVHERKHIVRSGLEGIAFAFKYGLDIMKNNGMKIDVVKVGNANLFLSKEFAKIFSNVCSVNVEIYNTDGAQGAARGAGIGSKYYSGFEEAFKNLKQIDLIKPDDEIQKEYTKLYLEWKKLLMKFLY